MQKRNSGNNRLARINEELKREISNIINYEVKNSNVTGMVSVTSAKITPDLRYAKITVSILNSKNVKAARDLVQFVPFLKYESNPEKLANEVLAEIPRQIIEYYTMNNIYPNNIDIFIDRKFDFISAVDLLISL